MTHAYSVEIHNYIHDKIAAAREGKKAAEKHNEPETRQFYLGQLEELLRIKKYLAEKIDLETQTYRKLIN
jgi:hypothetical protein